MGALGRLERFRARAAWPHEAQDFTPWLLSNAAELGAALGMDLELSEAEHGVGDFSLDLVGRDLATGDLVIVENQLERSDHGHLGQLLTYAGGTDATNVVWIADEFRSEHRAALDWLNVRTGEDTRFFAVEVCVVRIGSSALAPLFDVVVQPNDWRKSVRSSAAGAAPSQRQERYMQFWARLLEELRDRAPGWTNARQSPGQNWITLPSGSGLAIYALVFGREGLRAEIYFGSPSAETNHANFLKAMTHRAELEAAFLGPLTWQELEGKKACRIATSTTGQLPADEDAWTDIINWFIDTATRLRAAVDSLGGMNKLLS